MKAHRYFAILVFVVAAAWVLTGDFSFVGSAVSEDVEQQTVAGREAAANAEAEEKLQSVGYAIVPTISHARTVRISGVTEADKTTQMTARSDGVIGELLVKQGDRVAKGDVIARLDPEGRDTAVQSAKQLVVQRRAEVEARQELVERGTLPRLQLDANLSALKTAESLLEQASVEMNKLEIVAAFDGIVDELPVEEGSSVGTGTPVATLIALDPVIGKGEVNESDLAIVSVGGTAELRLVTGKTVTGEVRYISRQADPATRTYTVEIEVENSDLSVPAGMTAEVTLRGEPVDATPVPRSVVTLSDDGSLGVRIVDEDDTVQFVPIDIIDDTTGALILAGIPKGARLIVAGQNFVGDGQKVDPVQADEEALNKLLEEAMSGVAVQ